MNSSEIVSHVSSKIKSDWVSISIDGKSFDSSQFRPMMDIVDHKFFKRISPQIRELLHNNITRLGSKRSVDIAHKSLMRALTAPVNTLFANIPGVDAP